MCYVPQSIWGKGFLMKQEVEHGILEQRKSKTLAASKYPRGQENLESHTDRHERQEEPLYFLLASFLAYQQKVKAKILNFW